MPFQYRVYGLEVESNQPIPGLEVCTGRGSSDVVIELQGDAPLPAHTEIAVPHYKSAEVDAYGRPTLVVRSSANRRSFLFHYADDTRFLIEEHGSRVFARWPAPLTLEDTATYLLGPILGFVLRLRGHICLHASSIVVDGGAVAFTGPSGAGKSTLAAALVALGHRALTEDVTPLRLADTGPWVEPGCPLIRLWQSSVQSLFGAADAMPLLTPNWDKRFQLLSTAAGSFADEGRPLRLIYVIDARRREPTTTIRTLSRGEALIELVRNTYANYLLDREMRAHEFGLLGQLLSRVEVRVLQFTDSFESLPRVCADILRDVERSEKMSIAVA